MKLYHTTRSDVLHTILQEGLVGDPINLSERDYRETIESLWGLQPGGMFQHENGVRSDPVLLEVDVTGLELSPDGVDGDDHYTFSGTIHPDRIKIASPS